MCDTLQQLIIRRDISGFQSKILELKNKSGNKYLEIFIKSIDWDINKDYHEYILNNILKLKTNFKKKYIRQFIKCISKDIYTRTSKFRLQINILVKLLKRIQINDGIIYNILKFYQIQPDPIKKYLIHELLGIVNYFTMYTFVIQSDLSTCWIEILTNNNTTQEELDYYCSRLTDSRLLYKLKSSIIIINKITNINSLLSSYKIKSALYILDLLHSERPEKAHIGQGPKLTINFESINTLCAIVDKFKGKKYILVNKIINKIMLNIDITVAMYIKSVVTNLDSHGKNSFVFSKEYIELENNICDKIINICSVHVHGDIARHIILKYFTGRDQPQRDFEYTPGFDS